MKWLLVLVIPLVGILNSCNKPNKPNVIVYGHAGTALHKDRAVFPPNTIESINNAINILDADGVEVDVQMTKDSVLVLFHDPYLDYSTKYNGCISDYTFNDLSDLTIDNSKYHLASLKIVLEILQKKEKSIYLDIKVFDYCFSDEINYNTFQYALNQSLVNITSYSKIVLGAKQSSFLKNINFENKSYETTSISDALLVAKENDFHSVLFFLKFINESDISKLQESGINWGLIDIKDKWTTKKAMSLNPNYVITDNIPYSKQLSN